MLLSVIQEFDKEYRKYQRGHVIKISNHALGRIEKRKGKRAADDFKEAAVNLANFLINRNSSIFLNIPRFAVRSQEENLIVIFGTSRIVSETDFMLCICTVWNMEDGDFFFREGMPVMDLTVSRTGVDLKIAREVTIKRNKKRLYQ